MKQMVEEDISNKVGESIKLDGGHMLRKSNQELTPNEAKIKEMRQTVFLIEKQHERSKETIKKI